MTKRKDSGLEAKVGDTASTPSGNSDADPWPEASTTTKLIVGGVLMRGSERIMRSALGRGLQRAKLDQQTLKDAGKKPGLLSKAVSFGAVRIATKSVPGAVLVGGGLIARTLVRRRRAKRKAGLIASQPSRKNSRDK
ncbi:hypothetical protein [Altererythrobacter sp. ZODW24]|uniref:hypothetical protein n=1 Tax=Altererythrobacter sp. ZODW24 TaxID=2185142 RepID=UPI000DF72ABA|nr:hypothetical protein [Altererythrobacter sp. ZODW24]